MSNKEKSRISGILKLIANKLETDSNFLNKLEKFLLENKNSKSITADNDFVDIWAILQQQGADGLNNMLISLNEKQLIKIIKMNNLDSSKLSYKWKKKDKLIELIKDRATDRINKGNTFLECGKKE